MSAYRVEWVPQEAFEALADARGRSSRDESPMDYCEPDAVARFLPAKTFADAVKLAKTKLADDYFGQVRIERVVQVSSRYTRDHVEAVAVWHLSDPDEALDEEAPEFRPDLDLLDGEHVVATTAAEGVA